MSPSSALKMETLHFFETFVSTCKSIWRYSPEHRQLDRRGSLKPQTVETGLFHCLVISVVGLENYGSIPNKEDFSIASR
jgi:hypothetical protein